MTTTAPSTYTKGFTCKETEAGKRGNVIHQLLEVMLKRDHKLESNAVLLNTFTKEVEPHLEDGMNEIADEARDIINGAFEFQSAYDPSTYISVETWIHAEDWVPGAKGRVDAFIVGLDTIQIIDLKTGSTPVKPDSDQMMAYAAWTSAKYPDRQIITTIIQHGEVLDHHHDPVQLREWADEKKEELISAKSEGYTDPRHQQLFDLLMELRDTPADEITGPLLTLMKEAESASSHLFKKANKEARENGREFEGFTLKGRDMTKYADIETIRTFMMERGYSTESFGEIAKPTKKKLEDVLTPEHFIELNETLSESYESAPNLKPIK